MDFFSKVYGNDEIKAMFSSLIAGGKLAHAYLICGAEGSGKKTLSFAVAATLAQKNADAQMCRRVESGYCPDVMLIKAPDDKKTTGVDAVREFIGTVALAPDELDFKMYIFDKADRLTVQAQNALLKVIEEPPQGVYIFLLCEEASQMLPTVRSRVQTVFTERLSPSEIREYFSSKGEADVISERFAFASRMCMGAIGKAASLMSDDSAYDIYNAAKKTVVLQSDKLRGVTFFDLARHIATNASNRDDFSLLLDYLMTAYGDLLREKFDSEHENAFYDNETCAEMSEKISLEMLEMSIEAVSKIKNGLLFNTNLTISAAVLAEKLWKAAG